MEVDEQTLGSPEMETSAAEPVVLPPPLPKSIPAPPASPLVNPAILRLAYTFEFWIVLLTIYTVWSQVGGQGHLDLIAWYIKLACGVGVAWCSVRMTKAMVENPRAWNRISIRWFLAVLVLATLAALITYWYHLHEVPDEPPTDENSAISVRGGIEKGDFPRTSSGPDREKAAIRNKIAQQDRIVVFERS